MIKHKVISSQLSLEKEVPLKYGNKREVVKALNEFFHGRTFIVPKAHNKVGPYIVNIDFDDKRITLNLFDGKGRGPTIGSDLSFDTEFGKKGDENEIMAIGYYEAVLIIVTKNNVNTFEFDLPVTVTSLNDEEILKSDNGQPEKIELVMESVSIKSLSDIKEVINRGSQLSFYDNAVGYAKFFETARQLYANKEQQLALSSLSKAISLGEDEEGLAKYSALPLENTAHEEDAELFGNGKIMQALLYALKVAILWKMNKQDPQTINNFLSYFDENNIAQFFESPDQMVGMIVDNLDQMMGGE